MPSFDEIALDIPVAGIFLRTFLATLLAGQKTGASTAARTVKRACLRKLDPEERRAFQKVDALRKRLEQSDRVIAVEDYGAGTRKGEKPPVRSVASIARRAATGKAWSRVLFRLTRDLRPMAALELGTNLGLGAAALASALQINRAGHLATIEGDPTLAGLARDHLASLGFGDMTDVIEGRFNHVLGDVCETYGPFDIIFLDGHHDEAATIGYVQRLEEHLTSSAVFVLDDIEPGRPVARAWRRLRRMFPAWTALYLGKYGVFLLPNDEADT